MFFPCGQNRTETITNQVAVTKPISLVAGAALGTVTGLAIIVSVHQDNGFLAGPGVVLGLAVAALGSVISLLLLVFLRKRGHGVTGLCACFLTMLAVMVLLPLIWPYPSPEGPIPLTQKTDN